MKTLIISTSALVTLATSALALPAGPAPGHVALIQSVRSNCQWVDNKWTYQKGDKRLVCRPDRPSGSQWSWHREGGREGWFHSGRKEWHHRNW